jgi:hypothetical protein
VTPYLLVSEIASRRWGHYAVEGAFGILHRPFEQAWSSAASDSDETTLMTVSLHTANFRELEGSRYLDPTQELPLQAASFCEAAIKILDGLPSTEAGLVSALQDNKLAGHSFDSYFAHAAAHPALKIKQAAFRRCLVDPSNALSNDRVAAIVPLERPFSARSIRM